jgi:hypothetical protein
LVYPSPGTTYDNVPIGGIVGILNGQSVLTYPNVSPAVQIKGAFILGAPTVDFAPWSTPGADVPGAAYVNTRGYAEMFAPVPITSITLDATSASAASAAGTEIGFINVPYPLRGYIIDVTLEGTTPDRLALSGAKLVVGTGGLVAGPLKFTLVARLQRDVRGVSVAPVVSFRKTFTLSVGP